MHKYIHRKHITPGRKRRGEASHALFPNTPDISTEQQTMGGNDAGGLSHLHRPLGELIRCLFCQSHAAGKVPLDEEDIGLHGGNLIQEGLCLVGRGDVRGRLLGILQTLQGLGKAQAWVRPDEFVWQGMQPVQHRVRLSTQGKRVRVLFNQADHVFDIGSKPRMMHSFCKLDTSL